MAVGEFASQNAMDSVTWAIGACILIGTRLPGMLYNYTVIY